MAKDWLEAIKYAKGRTLANPDTTPEAECAKLLAFLKQGQWLPPATRASSCNTLCVCVCEPAEPLGGRSAWGGDVKYGGM